MSANPERLELDRPPGVLRPYAHLYRFGGDAPGPRVIYVGGAITRATYEERRTTSPDIIVEALSAARARTDVERVDLLCCPCPIDTEGLGHEWILEHVDEVNELAGPPTMLAAVGYSAGAAFATTLALLDERACAVALFGAANLPRTLEALRPFLEHRARQRKPPLPAAYFVNTSDPTCSGDTSWMRLHAAAVSFDVQRSDGGHPFVEYHRNGSVERAFAFVLRHLVAPREAEVR